MPFAVTDSLCQSRLSPFIACGRYALREAAERTERNGLPILESERCFVARSAVARMTVRACPT
jgi:hypothetical protein